MMSKTIVVLLAAVLAALFCSVVAHPMAGGMGEVEDDYSQMALFEDDATEISGLAPERQLFSDFCIRTRDNVRVFLKESASTGAKGVFNILFNSDDDFELDEEFQDEVDGDAVEVSAKIIKEGIDGENANNDNNNNKNNMEERVEAVKRSSVFSAISQAVRTVINSAIEFISTEAARRLAKLRARFTVEEIKVFINDACDSITYTLKNKLNDDLFEEKRRMLKSSDSKPFEQTIAATRIEDVGCVTTNRIAVVGKICGFLNVAGTAIYPLFLSE